MKTKSDTPRTDFELAAVWPGISLAIDFARQIERELSDWKSLSLWGGTPEHIHDFIKGQQARIHAAEEIENKLAAIARERDRLQIEANNLRWELFAIRSQLKDISSSI